MPGTRQSTMHHGTDSAWVRHTLLLVLQSTASCHLSRHAFNVPGLRSTWLSTSACGPTIHPRSASPTHLRIGGRESGHRERLQHRVRRGDAAVDELHLVAHVVTSFSRFAAAASCASRFDAPVPRATCPATSTSTTKSRRCSGPVASSTRYVGSASLSPCAHS